jgi:hypothetical protein
MQDQAAVFNECLLVVSKHNRHAEAESGAHLCWSGTPQATPTQHARITAPTR